LVVVVGRHVIVAALHIVAWCVVANDKMLDDPFSVQVGVPVMFAVLFVPARVIVIVQGAELESATVELVKLSELGIVAPASVSLPTV
jgi:ethanolamine utilization microcompartment shell protein EutL